MNHIEIANRTGVSLFELNHLLLGEVRAGSPNTSASLPSMFRASSEVILQSESWNGSGSPLRQRPQTWRKPAGKREPLASSLACLFQRHNWRGFQNGGTVKQTAENPKDTDHPAVVGGGGVDDFGDGGVAARASHGSFGPFET
jgi:hypothetical protein